MNSKKVLYIGTPIFNYHKKIISEFEAQGYSVDYYNDRPSESSIVKGLIKVKKNLMTFFIQRYFERILFETRDVSYDVVFIVNCKVFTPVMIQKLRDCQKEARFILYMWDSLKLYPNSEDLIPLFDKVYSFDLEDCNRLDRLCFLPLFYTETYENLGQENNGEIQYDIISVCTVHPVRYKIMSKLFPELENRGIRIFSYMFLNKLQYFYNKTFILEFKSARSKEFRFKPLLEKDYLEVLRKSNTVFDIQHNEQSGLTMRTIETLGAKRKLITTNINIKNYDFFNENNIFIITENNLSDIEEFLKNKYDPICDEVYKKYSLSNWIKTILNELDHKYLKKSY